MVVVVVIGGVAVVVVTNKVVVVAHGGGVYGPEAVVLGYGVGTQLPTPTDAREFPQPSV